MNHRTPLPASTRPRRRSRAEQLARTTWRYGCDGLCAWLGLNFIAALFTPQLGLLAAQDAVSGATACLALASLAWEQRETPPRWFVRLSGSLW